MDIQAIAFIGMSMLAILQDGPPLEVAPRPLSVHDALGQRSFPVRVPFAISPDGRHVAYTVQDNARRVGSLSHPFALHTRTGVPVEFVGCDVRVIELATGGEIDLTGGRGSNWGPTWSPDGRQLAFCSDRDGITKVWIGESKSGRLRPLTGTVARPVYGFDLPRWMPDGRKLLMKVLSEGVAVGDADSWTDQASPRGGEAAAGAGVTASVHRSPPSTGEAPSAVRIKGVGKESADLALIDVEAGTVERLATRLAVRGWWPSPDGSRVAFSVARGFGGIGSGQILYDISIVSPGGGPPRLVAAEQRLDYGITISWSPDGRHIAYTTSGPEAKGDCLLVSTDGGEPVNLTPGDHPDFGHPYRTPLWTEDGRSILLLGGDLWRVRVGDRSLERVSRPAGPAIVEILSHSSRAWSPDGGKSMILVTRDDRTKQVGFQRLDMATGEKSRLVEEHRSYGGFLHFNIAVAPDGSRVVYRREDAQHPPDLWESTPDFREPRRLTRINPPLEGYTFGEGRLVRWRGGDGSELRGALLLPSGYREGRRYPLIVDVYAGGMNSDLAQHFGGGTGRGVGSLHLLTTRGYAVLLPDIPVRPGRLTSDLHDSVMSGVDKLVEAGIADPDRLGVMGFSHGGYSTLSLISRTTRFRAAVMVGGYGDFAGLYGMMGPNGDSIHIAQCEEAGDGPGGPPWSVPSRYVEESPIYRLDRVETPLMIIHGSLDNAVPVALAEQVFVGLRRLGREAVYARYEGEEHWPGRWSYPNAADQTSRVIDWFESHLGTTAARPR